jgi:hypothetical protein
MHYSEDVQTNKQVIQNKAQNQRIKELIHEHACAVGRIERVRVGLCFPSLQKLSFIVFPLLLLFQKLVICMEGRRDGKAGFKRVSAG